MMKTRAIDIDCPKCKKPAGTYCNGFGVGCDLCQARIKRSEEQAVSDKHNPVQLARGLLAAEEKWPPAPWSADIDDPAKGGGDFTGKWYAKDREGEDCEVSWYDDYGAELATFVALMRAISPVLARAVIEQDDELRKLREFIAASKECAEAHALIELQTENERIRLAMTQALEKLSEGAAISNGLCSWCNERWLHLDGSTAEEVRAEARRHAFRCKSHPMKLERDAVIGQLDAIKAALSEALDYAEERDVMAEPGGWKRIDAYEARIAELRRLLT